MSGGNKPSPEQLPLPSYAPALMAAGILCLVWGVITSWLLSFGGLGIILGAAVRWARDMSPGNGAS